MTVRNGAATYDCGRLEQLLTEYRPMAADRLRRTRELLRLEQQSDRAFIAGIEAAIAGDHRRENREHAVFADAQSRLDDVREKVLEDEKGYRRLEQELASEFLSLQQRRASSGQGGESEL